MKTKEVQCIGTKYEYIDWLYKMHYISVTIKELEDFEKDIDWRKR